jgi:hypothetical protein
MSGGRLTKTVNFCDGSSKFDGKGYFIPFSIEEVALLKKVEMSKLPLVMTVSNPQIVY